MAPVLKIKSNGQVHRVVLPDGEPTYEKVKEAISQVCTDGAFEAKYLDEDGDLCTLFPGSFGDFLALFDGKTLKVEVSAALPPSASSAAPPEATAGPTPFNMVTPEFTPEASQENPMANLFGGFLQGVEGRSDSFSAKVDAAKPFLEVLAGKAAFFGGHHDWKGCGKGGHGWTPKKITFMLAQLRKNGVLYPKSAAALILHALPQLVEHIAERGEKLNCVLKHKMPELCPVIKDLQSLAAGTPGLEECEPALTNLMSEESETASDVVLTFLTALGVLPFEAKAAFLEAFLTSQETRLEGFLAQADESMPWLPSIPLEHVGITCDGCKRCPVKGLRFKCKSCPDYDLCAECFVDKAAVHGGECSGHNFDMMFSPMSSGWHWMQGMGKGMGKRMWKHVAKSMWEGKGKCAGEAEAAHEERSGKSIWNGDGTESDPKEGADGKDQSKVKGGKAKGKCCMLSGKRSFHKVSSEAQDELPRSCARRGCSFAATWHPTHCCARCAQSVDGTHHGPRCERKSAPDAALTATSDTGGGAFQPGQRYDLTFPVEVEDGRRLTISWNKEDIPEHVAETFAQTQGIPPSELATIVAFVRHANAVTKSGSGMGESESEAAGKETIEVQSSMDVERAGAAGLAGDVAQAVTEGRTTDEKKLHSDACTLAEMGLGSAEELSELLRNNQGNMHKVIETLLDGR